MFCILPARGTAIRCIFTVWDKIKFVFARPRDESAIKQFLEANDLLHQDIKPADLKHFLMARDSSGLIGLVGLEVRGDCALMRSLAVNRGYRNKGLATSLVDRIENYARSLKISTLYVLTMTAEDFFKKRAFRGTARETAPAGIQNTAEFRGLCPVSAAFMTKPL
jgi:amino-acid N-acetyltransferase